MAESGRDGEPRGGTRGCGTVSGPTMHARRADPGPCGGALGLLEQVGLAGRLEAGDAAEVGA